MNLKQLLVVMAALSATWFAGLAYAYGFDPAIYNVAWNKPAENGSLDSMPLGNGSTTLNAWIEANGTLSFYIGSTDSYDNGGCLVKVGKLHFRPSVNPLAANSTAFRQVLHLEDGTLRATAGEGEAAITYRLWVDANHPVINVELTGKKPFSCRSEIDPWRLQPQKMPAAVTEIKPRDKDGFVTLQADTLLKPESNAIGWYRANEPTGLVEALMQFQGLTYRQEDDLLERRVFGALVSSARAQALDERTLLSGDATEHTFQVYVRALWPSNPDAWLKEIKADRARSLAADRAVRYQAHSRWWHDFWQRSWIEFSGGPDNTSLKGDPASDTFVVSRAYQLQRYTTACNGKGEFPIQFNGAALTTDSPYKKQQGPNSPVKTPVNADYRAHGAGLWWQNTRFSYIGMCAAGDTELMHSLLHTYGEVVRKHARERAQKYAGVGGQLVPECLFLFGPVPPSVYGPKSYAARGGKPGEEQIPSNSYLRKHWNGQLESAWMMLDYYEYTLDEKVLKETILPYANDSLRFFHEYFSKNDAQGKILMEDSNALESWWHCLNPSQDIAGITALCTRLLSVAQPYATPEEVLLWKDLLQRMPPLPLKDTPAGKAFTHAVSSAPKSTNFETPELYAVSW